MYTQATLLTLDEAARLLRMSKSKLRADEQAGKIQFLRFNRVVRVDRRELESYIRQAAQAALARTRNQPRRIGS